MKMSKKIFIFFFSAVLIFTLSGCKKENKDSYQTEHDANARAFREITEKKNGQQLTILCTVFPIYDWCKAVLGEESNNRIKLELMMKKGTDLHNFQPSVADLARLNSCDVLFYIGGESDQWIKDALVSSKNKNQMRFSFIDLMQEIMQESELQNFFEGMSLFEEDEFEEQNHNEKELEEEKEYDEHIWLSLKNASFGVQFCESILQALDPENAEIYQNRMELYLNKVNKLDEEFRLALSEKPVLLFADRFPFRYFTEEYGLPYYAAFPGCSAETEASFATVISLSEKVKALKLDTIYILENSDTKLADQIIRTAGTETKIRVLNSMQNVNDSDIKAGVTYLKLMEQNLEALRGND